MKGVKLRLEIYQTHTHTHHTTNIYQSTKPNFAKDSGVLVLVLKWTTLLCDFNAEVKQPQ